MLRSVTKGLCWRRCLFLSLLFWLLPPSYVLYAAAEERKLLFPPPSFFCFSALLRAKRKWGIFLTFVGLSRFYSMLFYVRYIFALWRGGGGGGDDGLLSFVSPYVLNAGWPIWTSSFFLLGREMAGGYKCGPIFTLFSRFFSFLGAALSAAATGEYR